MNLEFTKAVERNNEHPALHECHVLILSSLDEQKAEQNVKTLPPCGSNLTLFI